MIIFIAVLLIVPGIVAVLIHQAVFSKNTTWRAYLVKWGVYTYLLQLCCYAVYQFSSSVMQGITRISFCVTGFMGTHNFYDPKFVFRWALLQLVLAILLPLAASGIYRKLPLQRIKERISAINSIPHIEITQKNDITLCSTGAKQSLFPYNDAISKNANYLLDNTAVELNLKSHWIAILNSLNNIDEISKRFDRQYETVILPAADYSEDFLFWLDNIARPHFLIITGECKTDQIKKFNGSTYKNSICTSTGHQTLWVDEYGIHMM